MKTKKSILKTMFSLILVTLLSNCCDSSKVPHNGIFPFSKLEQPQSKKAAMKHSASPQRMQCVLQYTPAQSDSFAMKTKNIQAGDVIAFYMPHKEARAYLMKGKIQKTPYELFRYGHLAVVVATKSEELRLLQVAMKQYINCDSTLEYLKDKSWYLFRPPHHSIQQSKLTNFAATVCSEDKGKSDYDYLATFGISNGNLSPNRQEDIRSKYTCATLVVAALSYSGYELHTPRRGGIADIITPTQVVDSYGTEK